MSQVASSLSAPVTTTNFQSSTSSTSVVPKKETKQNKTLTEQLIHSLEIDGRPIVQMRKSDGFCSLTFMAKAAGKKTNDYMRMSSTKDFFEELKSNTGNHVLEKQVGGDHGGTWGHPQVAIHMAQWCSPKFAVAVSELVFKFMSGQLTTEESQETGRALFVGDVFNTPERLEARAKDKTARKTMRDLIKTKLSKPGSSDYAIPANIVNVFAMNLPEGLNTKKFMKAMKLKGPAADYQSVQQLSCATWINDCLYEWLDEQPEKSVTRKQLIDKANFYGRIIAPVGRASRKLLEY